VFVFCVIFWYLFWAKLIMGIKGKKEKIRNKENLFYEGSTIALPTWNNCPFSKNFFNHYLLLRTPWKIIILAKSRYFDGPGLVVTDESGKDAVPGFIPPHPDTGTVVNPVFWFVFREYFYKRNWVFATTSNFLISISLQLVGINLWYLI